MFGVFSSSLEGLGCKEAPGSKGLEDVTTRPFMFAYSIVQGKAGFIATNPWPHKQNARHVLRCVSAVALLIAMRI